jgi:hypothetical protein
MNVKEELLAGFAPSNLEFRKWSGIVSRSLDLTHATYNFF